MDLPYRMVYAVATIDTVLIYDTQVHEQMLSCNLILFPTQHHHPVALIGNLHCAALTDIAWPVLYYGFIFVIVICLQDC